MCIFFDNMPACIDKWAADVVKLLGVRNLRLATAESCTGGLLSGAITSVNGASGVFEVGICAYANRIKEQYLGVKPQTLRDFGAVSAECAAEMAAGIRTAACADIGVSVTGIAGPGGGTPQKPVGTVFVGCSYGDKTRTLHLTIDRHSREAIRLETVRQALVLLTAVIETEM
ncbi:MAG: CinA family protein [Oscillospiraceae bacterium]|nr:CinA family protein [Oscillospiraceae bacterium]